VRVRFQRRRYTVCYPRVPFREIVPIVECFNPHRSYIIRYIQHIYSPRKIDKNCTISEGVFNARGRSTAGGPGGLLLLLLLFFFISFDFVAVSHRCHRGGVFNPRPSSLDRNRYKALALTTIIQYVQNVCVCAHARVCVYGE
jgi:hypothetical protein